MIDRATFFASLVGALLVSAVFLVLYHLATLLGSFLR